MVEEEPNEAKQAHRSVSSEIESACGCGCDAADEAVDMMPDEELLYDLADLFKVFGDTTRIKILYALMTKDRVLLIWLRRLVRLKVRFLISCEP